MSASAAHWLPYRLPLRHPWITAAGTFHEREGRLLRLDGPDGLTGWGDCAPLAEAGIDENMAIRFAEECAQLDLAARTAGMPLVTYLAGTEASPGIAVNAALGNLGPASEEAMAKAIAAGFDLFKFKVGNDDPVRELQHLTALAALLPAGGRFRLDANRAWDGETARHFVAACGDLPVEAIEEPLRSPTLAALTRLQQGTAIALALDESLPHFAIDDLFSALPVRRLILKPARQGGLLATLSLGRRARAAGLECIVTSSFESACGLAILGHLAAALAPDAVHGLATADWLAADTGQPPALAAGRLFLLPGPGSGFAPRLS